MTRRDDAERDRIEHALQHGDVVFDTPGTMRAKCGQGQFKHVWGGVVCNDGSPGPFYSRECRRCGVMETALQPGGPWEEA